jgi:hypothetical protein
MVQLSFDAEMPGVDHEDATVATNTDAGALFISSLLLPVQDGLLRTPPRQRREPASLVPRRSDRLAAKAPFRDPNPEKQAKRVMVNKWERRPDNAVTDTTDDKIADKFHETFAEPLSPNKREALRELIHVHGELRNTDGWATP